uniref:Uncharacterized protein n=1 Tax=Periophthalmus magnuspinnatus TaxID=409849 RepID=A0A3B4AG13_9GOBI
MEWWKTVAVMEEAADRVYMAARLFVQLFNQRGASLQHRILELLALADAADQFHKKTVTAAVGGGVASVAGSIATITGLILAPFTFGASIIVTAVGIGVATAGSITSATANITDTVHSNMDRKNMEKMIQGYQDEVKDIRECLEFVQEGIDTLQEWDFEKFSESAAKKALNHNIKHVVKEGGRAGKALMINTDKLISTVQVLGAAGGAAKAVQAISVTTGVMSALFLALDVFFLAKDSHELRKGAKTKFASKIRDVCKDLQAGLLELNKTKQESTTVNENKTVQDPEKGEDKTCVAKQELTAKVDLKVSVKNQDTVKDDVTRAEETSSFKSLRESWMAKQENVYSKTTKEIPKTETNVDQKVKSIRENWMAKEEIKTKTDERVTSPKESYKGHTPADSPSLLSKKSSEKSSSSSHFRSDRNRVETEEKQSGHFERGEEAE